MSYFDSFFRPSPMGVRQEYSIEDLFIPVMQKGYEKTEYEIVISYRDESLKETLRNCKFALYEYPDGGNIYYVRGSVYEDLGELTKAISDFEKYCSYFPDRHNGYFKLGVCYEALKKYPEAINYYKKSIECWKQYKNSIPRVKRANYIFSNIESSYNNLGVCLANSRDVVGAIRACNRAIHHNIDYPNAYYLKGVLMWKIGAEESDYNLFYMGIEGLKDAANLGAQPAKNIISQYNLQHHIDNSPMKATSTQNKKAYNYYKQGLEMYFFQDFSEAEFYYSQALIVDPNFSDVYRDRGALYDDLNKYQEAMKDYNKGIELAPNDPTLYCNRGSLLLKVNFTHKAIVDYNKAIQLLPSFALAYKMRAKAKEEIGDITGAQQDYYLAQKYS
ncbi:tetratricopeptide repeat protein [Aureispira anguillae]|uniref:Tetratricopeptide repeat protein n=1 Tax=Aureispira anguillae TaxID=2864201 RepID=A0A915VMJ4_9BACT|nr:tetratricopeptide repeat protein [Aureispira anguillae]BDS09580.1 tetratricopeptide repeat protein [Aureispira anguillae]